MAKYNYHKQSNGLGIRLLCILLAVIAVISLISLLKRSFRNMSDPFGDISYNDPFGNVSGLSSNSGSDRFEIPDVPVEKNDPSIENRELLSEDAGLKVVFLDVGQGDATLIEVLGDEPGYILVDGGYPECADTVLSYLQQENIDHLDYVVGTHAHADHVGSLSAIMKSLSVATLLVPQEHNEENYFFEDMLDTANDEGVNIEIVKAGYSFHLGNAEIRVLGPVDVSETIEEVNNTSIVLKVDFGAVSFVLGADAEVEEEDEILETGSNVKTTVLKIGHHGSSSSTGYLWLRQTNPMYAVISCGWENEYGHPTERTLSRIEDAEIKLFRTDLQGTIVFWTDGETINYSVEFNDDINTFDYPGTYVE